MASVQAGSAPLPPRPESIRLFEQMAFGLFLHYGLYSLHERGEWVRHHHRLDPAAYNARMRQFTATAFDAPAIVQLARDAGQRYICMTTRHHEGFSLYDTRGLSDFDAPHSAAGRDLVAEMARACQAEGMPLFLYHTTLDWNHPDFDAPGRWDAYLEYLNASVEVLCRHYGPIGGFWFDGNWARKDRDWKESELYAVCRKYHPDAILVNNSSTGALGHVGHPMLDVITFEQGRPTRLRREGMARYYAQEMCETFNTHWGMAAADVSFKGPPDLIRTLAQCRRFGANLLLNAGPQADGSIGAYEAAALRVIGHWIRTFAPCIYTGEPTTLLCRGEDFVLRDAPTGRLFYACCELPTATNEHAHRGERAGPRTVRGDLPAIGSVQWTDTGEELAFTQSADRRLLAFDATANPYGRQAVVRFAELVCAGA